MSFLILKFDLLGFRVPFSEPAPVVPADSLASFLEESSDELLAHLRKFPWQLDLNIAAGSCPLLVDKFSIQPDQVPNNTRFLD